MGALDLYLKGCSRGDGKDLATRDLSASACQAAARIVDLLGDKARAVNLRRQAAQLREPK